MKSKKGSHVGVVLSFVIFVTFLIFLYSILQPSIRIKGDKENLLENLEIELTQKFSSEIETIVFVIDATTTSNCVQLENLIGQLANPSFIIKNESGGLIEEVRENGGDLFINRASVDLNFFKVYDSVEFDSVESGIISGCEFVSEDQYTFKSAEFSDEIFFSLINKTILEYDEDYDLLKEELNVPVESNFGFSFTDDKTFSIETPEENVSTSVYVGEVPVLFIDNDATIKSGFLTIKVW